MKSEFSASILLATYNGSRYLEAQLESLWRQSFQDFEIIVRDDGSTDGTPQILEREAARHPNRLRIIKDSLGRLGPKSGFASLLGHTNALWIAFCDQDDHWLPHKIQLQISKLEEMENAFGRDTPLLCCSDAAVTDSQLQITSPSYFKRHNISIEDGRDLKLSRLLFRNYAIGATTMINAALARRARSMPAEAIMHDWWCALLACIGGHSLVLPDPLILYRQHGGNAVGSRHRAMPKSLNQLQEYVRVARANSARCIYQTQALHHVAGELGLSMSGEAQQILEKYASFSTKSKIGRGLTVFNTRAFKPGLALNGLHFYACMTTSL